MLTRTQEHIHTCAWYTIQHITKHTKQEQVKCVSEWAGSAQTDGSIDGPLVRCSWCSRSIEGTKSPPLGSAQPPCYTNNQKRRRNMNEVM